MQYRRMPIEIESPGQMGYASLDCNLTVNAISVSPGMMERRYRIGFGWPQTDELTRGLANISKALAEAV